MDLLGITVRRNSDDDLQVTSDVANQLLEFAGLTTSHHPDDNNNNNNNNNNNTWRRSSEAADKLAPADGSGDFITTTTNSSNDTTTAPAAPAAAGSGGRSQARSPPAAASRLSGAVVGKPPTMSSQNYEDNESEVARLYEVEQHQGGDAEHDDAIRSRTRKRALIRWLINLAMAVVVESIYLFISFASSSLLKDKAHWVLLSPTPLTKYLTKLSFSLLYASLAFLMVYLVPTSAGSGIPETKAFLNGIRIPNMQSLRTLLAKVLGTIFAVSAGLPLGKYGPMIHIGSIVAAFMSRGARGIKQVDRLFESFRIFSTHSEKRDLVVSGAAAGVTAAFGAPIGGLMLAWEEGSSYWSLKVSWRVFFCAMATLLFTYMVADSKAVRDSKFVNQSYVESYAGSFSTGIRVANRDLVVFAFMGIAGGAMGAGFNHCHKLMSGLRGRFVSTWRRKFGEVMAVTFMVVTVSFIAAYFSESWACRPLPPKDPHLYKDGTYATSYFGGLLQLTCPRGHYNEMATLYMNDGVTALRLIFHLPRLNPSDGSLIFSNQALLLFVLPYFLLMISTFGIAVPSGFFVPQLLVGATLGRLFGEVLINSGWPTYFGQVRIFAIMGSAAFVGGISRMVLSMTVIMLEATGDLFFLLPFAVVLLTSHWVGDLFNPSIYEMIIQMKKYPFLRPDPPKWAIGVLRASDIMTKDVTTLRPIEQVRVIRDLLSSTEHNMFPTIYSGGPKDRALFGTVMRESLVVLLQAGAFSTTSKVNLDPDSPDVQSPVLDYPSLLKRASRLSSRQVAKPVFHFSAEEEDLWVDLRPYSNPSIYYVTEDSSVTKVYRVFRGLGLRHLLVLNTERHITGVIARYDLMPLSLKARLEEIRSGRRQAKASWTLTTDSIKRANTITAPRIATHAGEGEEGGVG